MKNHKSHPIIDYICSSLGCIQGTIFETVRILCDMCTPDEEIINSFVDGFNSGKTTTDYLSCSPKSSSNKKSMKYPQQSKKNKKY